MKTRNYNGEIPFNLEDLVEIQPRAGGRLPSLDQARDQARNPLRKLIKLILGGIGAWVMSLAAPPDLQVFVAIGAFALVVIVLMFEK